MQVVEFKMSFQHVATNRIVQLRTLAAICSCSKSPYWEAWHASS